MAAVGVHGEGAGDGGEGEMTKDEMRAFIDGTDCVVKFRRLPHGWGLPVPSYASAGAAGIDLRAAFTDERIEIAGGTMAEFETGFAVEIPRGYEGQVRLRSSLGRLGLIIPNAPGTIDSDYRGEIRIVLANIGTMTHTINRGDRVAQLIIAPVARASVVEVQELSETARGAGGFGSTGR